MKFKMDHQNFNVFDLERSIKFYTEALGLDVLSRKKAEDGSWEICYLGNDESQFRLELTWMKQYDRPYDLGDCEFHLAFVTEDYEAAHAHHEKMGCIEMENPEMGIYFITDPDGYWLEIVPSKN
ncbi:MAG: VOC family protein [Dethiobacteria bacterium]|jgi:lactoylglutathione lyase|nr:lactoylglutathione lyase [Clostridiales bacterium]